MASSVLLSPKNVLASKRDTNIPTLCPYGGYLLGAHTYINCQTSDYEARSRLGREWGARRECSVFRFYRVGRDVPLQLCAVHQCCLSFSVSSPSLLWKRRDFIAPEILIRKGQFSSLVSLKKNHPHGACYRLYNTPLNTCCLIMLNIIILGNRHLLIPWVPLFELSWISIPRIS